ncbi:MerR family transcriptional regulator [Frankia sp. AiPa1]|uniref:MerR family transcriptional regulator n=1 Tax=Frankia sp. AiPa1 TaxID=573492 RepID=UPI00202B0FB7|nr:MerR family transcriptional regulator [Frankia sp. AiPa1]MCL9762840.1 MerR family transcriptional regulator [Frankia sp. AiPa1]
MTLMSVGVAAELCGVSPNALRFYERVGLLEPVRRDGAGRRLYDEETLASIRFVILMRDTGMPLRVLHEYLGLARQGERTAGRRRQILEEQRLRLRRQRTRIDDCLTAIDGKIDECPRSTTIRSSQLVTTTSTGESA